MSRFHLRMARSVSILLIFISGTWAANLPSERKNEYNISKSPKKDRMWPDRILNLPQQTITPFYVEHFSKLFRYADPGVLSEEKAFSKYNERQLYTQITDQLMKGLTSPDTVSKTMALLKAGPGYSDVQTCATDLTNLFALSSNKTVWAMRMIDSWGKPGAGIFSAQPRYLGEYDECMDITPVGQGYDRQYCLEMMYVQRFESTVFNPPIGFALGTCVPTTCKPGELMQVLSGLLATLQPNIVAGAYAGSCQKNELELSDKAIAVICVCGAFASVMLLGTLYDIIIVRGAWKLLTPRSRSNTIWLYEHAANSSISEGKKTHRSESEPLLKSSNKQEPAEYTPGVLGKTLLSFSVYTNGSKVLSTKTGGGTIECINGIRVLSMSWVILGHAFSMSNLGVVNTAEYSARAYKRWTFQAIANALVSVDTFFTLSGLLMMYLVMKELNTKRRPGPGFFFHFYFHRFWRLTPPYMLVMMLDIVLFRYVGDGPLWPQGGTERDDCEDTWWTNLLYVNNVVKNKEMCMGWSWYLANDMQFFVISPIIFLPIFYFKWFGMLVPVAMLVGNAIASGVITKENSLQPNVFNANPKAGDWFNDYYIKPYTRIGPYLVGMMSGYLLYLSDCRMRLNKLVVATGWAFAWAIALACVYGLFYHSNGVHLTDDLSALYNALHRIGWGVAISWVIFACGNGYGGFINTILSWKAFVPLSRLTYCAYLVHPLVIYYFFFQQRHLIYLDNNNIAFIYIGIVVLAFASAFVASMAFEAPMLGLEKVILGPVGNLVKKSVTSALGGTASRKDGHTRV